LRIWLKVAALSFGGPAGQIAVMHRIIVEEKRWISEARFLHALNHCMLLPGPEAQQLATYIGWLMHRTLGGVMAGGQQAVESYGWLQPGEMLGGLGMAETTPGPLIMVLQFLGFMAAYRDPGALSPMLAGTLGVHAVLPVDLPRRSIRRGSARQQGARRRPFGDNGCGLWRDRQFGDLVCNPHNLSSDDTGSRLRTVVRCTSAGQRRPLGPCARGRRRPAVFLCGRNCSIRHRSSIMTCEARCQLLSGRQAATFDERTSQSTGDRNDGEFELKGWRGSYSYSFPAPCRSGACGRSPAASNYRARAE